MALKFRLKGLAETFIDEIRCRSCGTVSSDDEYFSTELSRVTLDGIVVVAQCKNCGEIFVPDTQRLGIVSPSRLREAVEKDCQETGEPLLDSIKSVKLFAEQLNAERKDSVH